MQGDIQVSTVLREINDHPGNAHAKALSRAWGAELWGCGWCVVMQRDAPA
jgi:hypothetical protein